MLGHVAAVVGGITLVAAYLAAAMFTGGAFPWPRRLHSEETPIPATDVVVIVLQAFLFPIPWIVWGLGWIFVIIIAMVMRGLDWATKVGRGLPSLSKAFDDVMG